MKTYRVRAKATDWLHMDVEAKSKKDAIDVANNNVYGNWVRDELLCEDMDVAPDGVEDVEEVE